MSDPMESVKIHDRQVTLVDLDAEITRKRGELAAVEESIAQAKAAWEVELADLRRERQQLIESGVVTSPPDDELAPDVNDEPAPVIRPLPKRPPPPLMPPPPPRPRHAVAKKKK